MEDDIDMKITTDGIGSDSEFEEFEGYDKYSVKISEFELIRLENIKKNKEKFDEYDIASAKENIVPKKIKMNSEDIIKKRKIDAEELPKRKSLRIQQIQTESENKPSTQSFHYDASAGDTVSRKPTKMDMQCVNDVEEDHFKTSVSSWLKEDKKNRKGLISNLNDVGNYKDKIASLTITDINKVTKSRGYCIDWYPSQTKKIVCMGDKAGSIGIWDVDCDQAFMFNVHSRPVSWLTFSQFDKSKMFSCSYDGTMTCGDLTQLTFTQKIAARDDSTRFNHFSFPCQQDKRVLLATSDGEILTLDLSSEKVVKRFSLSNKRNSARCVDCHPLNENLIATSSSDGTLATWDLRYVKKKGNKYLSAGKAAKTIVKSFFSPLTGNKLLMTSQDHFIRVFDVNGSGIVQNPSKHPIKHENYYGRWLTTFRAMWDPKTDHSFVCGSMANPRRLDLFTCDEKKKRLLSYSLHDESLTIISSVNVFHPQFDMMASSNSSGKMFIWS